MIASAGCNGSLYTTLSVSWPDVVVVYNCTLNNSQCAQYARRFVSTYRSNPPGVPHRTVIVFNHGTPTETECRLFFPMTDVSFFCHDNSGWDIGGFIAVSKTLKPGMAVYFGSHAYFHRPGWLRRMSEAWRKHGPGFYGASASYYMRPHITTTAFWTKPEILCQYPLPVRTKPERYAFEHGPNPCWRFAQERGLPIRLVTWDGEWEWRDWRTPANLYNRGDQTNCLVWNKHIDYFKALSPAQKRQHEKLADTITDWEFTRTLK